MKNALLTTLFILVFGCLGYWGLPWWGLAVVAGVAAWFFPLSGGKSFSTAFAAGFLLWFVAALLHNMSNGGILSAKIGVLFMGVKGWHLMSITALFGGLLAGFGALTSSYARQMMFPDKPRRYGRRR
ncbi:MAG: hypothetical protein LCH81_04365 [Bacteroidetes bacterium]|nr:hypothetical protein [Bacteroidota bacterium]